ncbi:DNA glycosylase [Polychaeton citri CBS 116435]|uniref:DNA glycosylase n=1 Tax=Polychaeton citri CBS 116435 TaxID=1314669 RepID=A0A9P4Q674_9PEZI|nr:DNA glycosylase [Polychaeton citri CBS 116435]
MAPVPPISAERFGLVQERLWTEPFKLLVACLFLNQTAGKYAMPVFFSLMESYPTVQDLANAKENDLFERIAHLGFGNQRSRKCISLAQSWLEIPPELGKRYRSENYPRKGDHKGISKNDVLEDAVEIGGAIEIAHLPGCGPYAYDSWRIFCRDAMRGVADDYNGLNARSYDNDATFEPEWKRVLPKDKELRACLRWMWLREGWIWNAETGERRQANEAEMEAARRGQMEVRDEKEKKFAKDAVEAQGLAGHPED